ncbi:toll/interleukin-1 receptor domain-containing protein [Hellea balneolensis]|uniref:toll/interleukin-1 receptor domain-containing protein n=1 Tax=Hellea balneolensis TaxID=287478 RepID=UPI0003FB6039|nr:toll/interleukin-1 receptor domain-containing protein [Hellea balneolensis]
MASSEHIKLLHAGPEKWNIWRRENPGILPDLSGLDRPKDSPTYTGYDFSKTSFARAALHGSAFIDCNFSNSDFRGIQAQGTYWRNSNFANAHISGDLILSSFYGADFTGATIENCGLIDAELRFVRLCNTTFSAYLGDTHINSWSIIRSDLSGIVNAEEGIHEYPSNIDIATLNRTAKQIRENKKCPDVWVKFFDDAGVPKEILDVFLSWSLQPVTGMENAKVGKNYFSCFISYSWQDREFAKRLHDELNAQGIHCWLDSHQIIPGANILDEIDRGIRKWDKVLLCCSSHALQSPWVDRELDKAFQKEEALWKERGEKTLVVIPLNLDNYMFEWNGSKASILKSRRAADFTRWDKENSQFKETFREILDALQADKSRHRFEPSEKL